MGENGLVARAARQFLQQSGVVRSNPCDKNTKTTTNAPPATRRHDREPVHGRRSSPAPVLRPFRDAVEGLWFSPRAFVFREVVTTRILVLKNPNRNVFFRACSWEAAHRGGPIVLSSGLPFMTVVGMSEGLYFGDGAS